MSGYTYIDQYRNETGEAEIVQNVVRAKIKSRIYHARFEGPAGIGENCQVGPDVTIGRYFSLNEDCYVARAKIGRFTSFGARTAINPFQHPTDWLSIHEFQYHPSPDAYDWYPEWHDIVKQSRESLFKQVMIGNDVWSGWHVLIMGDLKIGDGAILAAGSVITRDVEPYAIMGGVPARLIRYRFSEKIIERLLAVKWWDLPVRLLSGLPFHDIENCLSQIEDIAQKYRESEGAAAAT